MTLPHNAGQLKAAATTCTAYLGTFLDARQKNADMVRALQFFYFTSLATVLLIVNLRKIGKPMLEVPIIPLNRGLCFN
jgi:hypothetical protein